MARMETGVDKLVSLVAKEKKIEVAKAAKLLGVHPTVVQEWAEFLEEEGIVSLQFSLSKTYILERRLSSVEVAKKGKEYENKKEAFVRRVDSTIKQLENETADFESIRKHYDEMKHHLGDEMDAVKEEMEQLRHYEELKKSIDSDILKQKVAYQRSLEDVRQQISHEERRYTKISGQIEEERKKLDQERTEFSDIRKEEQDLLRRIDALKDIVRNVHSRLSRHAETLDMHESRITTLRDLSEKLKEDIVERRSKEIEPLLKVSDDQSKRILRIQDEIVGKVKSGRDKLREFEEESKEISEKFEVFFTKRSNMEQTLHELEKAKSEMQEELNDLIRKAKAFEITEKSADTNAHLKELEEKFQHFDRRRSAFARQLDYLKQMIVGKASGKSLSGKGAVQRKASTSRPMKKGVSKKSVKRSAESSSKKPVKKPAKRTR